MRVFHSVAYTSLILITLMMGSVLNGMIFGDWGIALPKNLVAYRQHQATMHQIHWQKEEMRASESTNQRKSSKFQENMSNVPEYDSSAFSVLDDM